MRSEITKHRRRSIPRVRLVTDMVGYEEHGTHFSKESYNNGTVGKFATSESTECLLGEFILFILDVDFSYAGIRSGTAWPWDLEVEDSAIFLTLLTNIFDNF